MHARRPDNPVDIAGLEVAFGDPRANLTLGKLAPVARSVGGVELALGVFNWDSPGAPDASRTSCTLFIGQASSLLAADGGGPALPSAENEWRAVQWQARSLRFCRHAGHRSRCAESELARCSFGKRDRGGSVATRATAPDAPRTSWHAVHWQARSWLTLPAGFFNAAQTDLAGVPRGAGGAGPRQTLPGRGCEKPSRPRPSTAFAAGAPPDLRLCPSARYPRRGSPDSAVSRRVRRTRLVWCNTAVRRASSAYSVGEIPTLERASHPPGIESWAAAGNGGGAGGMVGRPRFSG